MAASARVSIDAQGPRLKIERADKHISDAEEIAARYASADPYEFVRDVDSETGTRVLRFRVKEEPPPELALIAGDAIHNLRSALDLLWCQLVIQNGKKISDSDTFPIAGSRDAFEATFRGVKQRLPRAARPIIEALCPYEGGNDGLWRLRKLDVIDKHRLLLAIWSAAEGFKLPGADTFPRLEGMADPRIPIPFRGAGRCLKDGEMFSLEVGLLANRDQDPEFTMGIALHEPPIVECEPLIPTLTQLRGTAAEILDLFAPRLTA